MELRPSTRPKFPKHVSVHRTMDVNPTLELDAPKKSPHAGHNSSTTLNKIGSKMVDSCWASILTSQKSHLTPKRSQVLKDHPDRGCHPPDGRPGSIRGVACIAAVACRVTTGSLATTEIQYFQIVSERLWGLLFRPRCIASFSAMVFCLDDVQEEGVSTPQ